MTTNGEITYKQGTCEIIETHEDVGDCLIGNYYSYTMIPTNCQLSGSDELQCIYDDSNNQTDCKTLPSYEIGYV